MAQETLLAITFGRASYLGQYLGGRNFGAWAS